jgi:para-nitrobenzyl esterase
MGSLAVLLVVAALQVARSDDAPLVIRTADGRVQGFYQGDSRAFLGIPFAAPPVGNLRFALPSTPEKWNHTLDASRLGARCIQTSHKGNPEQTQSEDCLHLNVFTPRTINRGALLPVIVYVHGGGQQTGCSGDFRAHNLAGFGSGTVVVVIQYRLNVFGYWLHEQLLANGTSNLGLQDQVLALRWVQSNVRAFGGDPGAVMVTGQSSGCSSVGFHLVYPPSWGLYSRAAMMSCAMNDWRPKSGLLADGTTLARTLGCDCSTSAATLSCMRAANASAVFDALLRTKGAKFEPCYNCVEIPAHPLALMRGGRVNRGAGILLGNARYEQGTAAAHGALGFPNSTVTRSQYEKGVLHATRGNASMAAAAITRYAPLVADVGYWYALATMNSHFRGVCGQQYQSTWLAALGNISLYRYVFTHATVDWPQRWQNATHTAGLPYVFRNASILDWFLGYRAFNAPEAGLSDRMAVAWRNFARSGNPNSDTRLWHENVSTGGRATPEPPVMNGWKQFDYQANFTFVLDNTPKQMQDGGAWHDSNEPYCSFWKDHFVGFPSEEAESP